jgi:putative sigma-54 modulation protein
MAANVNISGRHVEVTPALDQYARNKISKLNVFNKVMAVDIVLSIDNKMQKAEAKVNIAGDQKSIFAEAASEDMYKSIDELDHKLYTQVKKYHDISTDHHRGEK